MSDHIWMPPRAIVTPEWLDGGLRADLAADVSSEERALYDKLVGEPGKGVVLYGGGNLGRRTLAGLRRVGIEPLAFADRSPSLQDTEIDGKRVLNPAAAVSEFGDSAAFVVAVWSPSRPNVIGKISEALKGHGASHVVSFVPLFWRHAAEFLPYFPLDLPHRVFENSELLLAAYALFRDTESRDQFRIQLSYLLSMMDAFDLPRGSVDATYFPPDILELSAEEVFVDCRAYDGDTLQSFLQATGGHFRAVVAFEPDPHAVVELRTYIDGQPSGTRDRIRVEQKAVGSAAGTIRFEGDGTPGSRASETGSVIVESVPLDIALRGLAPTFIKMDIEGAEEGALLGAAETIRLHRPVLAICVYHLQADLHRLPTLIGSLAEDYSLFLRRQGPDGDLVCFAIPNERLPSRQRS